MPVCRIVGSVGCRLTQDPGVLLHKDACENEPTPCDGLSTLIAPPCCPLETQPPTPYSPTADVIPVVTCPGTTGVSFRPEGADPLHTYAAELLLTSPTCCPAYTPRHSELVAPAGCRLITVQT